MRTINPPPYEGYTEYKGFYFKDGTPQRVMEIIADNRHTGRRLRLWQGDAVTGKPWLEEYGIIGHIGRSTGPKHSALLIANSRSHGGGAILTHCIVAIQDVKTKQFLYKNDKFTIPEFTIAEQPNNEYRFKVGNDIECVAAFKTERQASRYVQFMRGERMAK